MKSQGVFLMLSTQAARIFRHNNVSSKETRHRYHKAALRFCDYLSIDYPIQHLRNIKPKHLKEYTRVMIDRGLSGSHIRNELSAIRFYYEMAGGRSRLPDNRRLEEILGERLPGRNCGKVGHAWDEEEYRVALALAEMSGDDDVALMLRFAWTLGLRVHETARVRRSDLLDAISTGYLRVKGKGGKIRDVPVTGEALQTIHMALEHPQTTQRVFVPETMKAHQVQRRVENWIYRHRDEFSLSDTQLTYHGLRHAYAQRRYEFHLHRLLGDVKGAMKAVSRELGHERADVTRIYLVGLARKSAVA